MKKIVLLALFIFINASSSFGGNHSRLLFSSSSTIKSNINTYTVLQNLYSDFEAITINNMNETISQTDSYGRFKMHYASDMAFIYYLYPTHQYASSLRSNAINLVNQIYVNAMYFNALPGENSLINGAAIFSIALTYDLLYNTLELNTKRDIATKIYTLINESKKRYFDGNFNQTRNLYGNNHNIVHATSIGVGALAIKSDQLNNFTFTADSAANYITIASNWMSLLDDNIYASDGGGFEGIGYGLFALQPVVAYYEMLKRNGYSDNFPSSFLKKVHQWAINELVPADARNSSITESLFDFNNVNATFNYYSYPDAPERDINIFSALGGIYNSEATSGAATWLFEHHLNILLSANVSPSYYFPTSVMLAFEKYANNSTHPDNISSMPEKTFYLGRGFIIRDGYADNGTLFSFETNFNYNQETGKTSFRWDENDNNSFTFFSNGRRWVIDSGKSISQPDEKASYHNTILIDNQEPVIPFDVSQQVINWYDYHYLNGQYYITSDVTDSQTKRVHPDPDPYNDFSGNGLTQTYTTPFSSFKRARRHAQIVLAKDNVPSYAVILDDIQVDSSSHCTDPQKARHF